MFIYILTCTCLHLFIHEYLYDYSIHIMQNSIIYYNTPSKSQYKLLDIIVYCHLYLLRWSGSTSEGVIISNHSLTCIYLALSEDRSENHCTTLNLTRKLLFCSSQLVPRSSKRPIWEVERTCLPFMAIRRYYVTKVQRRERNTK